MNRPTKHAAARPRRHTPNRVEPNASFFWGFMMKIRHGASGRRARAVWPAALVVALGLACDRDAPLQPSAKPEPETERPGTPRALGLMQITLTLGDGAPATHAVGAASAAFAPGALTFRASAAPLDSLAGGVQLEPIRTGSFTHGTRGDGGVRYVFAAFRVRNAAADGTPYADARTNLTFIPVETESTIDGTPFSKLLRFDGTDADPAIATQILPAGHAQETGLGGITSVTPDVLQLYTESEVSGGELPLDAGVLQPFPYGFVVRRADGTTNTRSLPADPGEDQFDGVVTFAFKVPLQATPDADPFQIVLVVQAVDDATTRITQSLEEQDAAGEAAFAARAAALGASQVTILEGGSYAGAARRLCGVRVAGTSIEPLATLTDCPTFTSLSLAPGVANLAVGGSAQLTPTLRDADGNEFYGMDVSWSSSDPEVLSVDPSGRLTANAAGAAIITATWGAFSARAIATAFEPSAWGNAIALSGAQTSSAPYVDVSPAPLIFPGQAFTIEAWIRWDGSQGYRVFLSRPANSNPQSGYAVVVNNGYLQSSANTGDLRGPVPVDRWVHVAFVINGNVLQGGSLYLNGVLVGEGSPFVASIAFGMPFLIGREFVAGQLDDRTFGGQIDEVRVWTTALDQTTIQNWMRATDLAGHPKAGFLAARYTFDEAGGSVAASSTGQYHGTMQNNPVRVARVGTVELSETAAELEVDETLQLTAEAYDLYGDESADPVVWLSNDPAVATVDANGLVTALAPGKATIVAFAEGALATATITVVE